MRSSSRRAAGHVLVLVCCVGCAAESPPSPPATQTGSTRGVVPDVVCQDLQHAQDAMQAAGFRNLTSRDATGSNRTQVVDRNWVVVAQSVVPGGTPDPTTRILLSAVKLGEPTAAAGCPS